MRHYFNDVKVPKNSQDQCEFECLFILRSTRFDWAESGTYVVSTVLYLLKRRPYKAVDIISNKGCFEMY